MLDLYNPYGFRMRTFSRLLLIIMLFGFSIQSGHSACANCCAKMGGIQYCDSSSGRYVCANGYYSSCYCDRHAVMDLQKFQGCCIWQGGVMVVDPVGLVICNNGGISELCSLQTPVESVSVW
jgi:hypothetical protein